MTATPQPSRLTQVRGLLYGGDYYPEQWPEDVWREDVELMRAAGVNVVTLGVFAWARLQPAPDRYDFDWLDRVIDLLVTGGVSVNLATPTASPPPWLVREHPEILPMTADGVTLWHGSRRHYCPHAEAYRAAARDVARALAEHVRHVPSIVAWHVDNEYSCHFSECFCDASAAAFRDWLRDRHGTLEALNDAWGSAFWSQIYGDWEEIQPPRRTPTFVNPCQRLDWLRFSSDSWIACFDDQAAVLRSTTPGIPITTNFMSFHKPLDYWKLASREDVVSNDSYPDPADPEWMVDAAIACDLMRSLGGGRPWLLMEQAPGNVNWRPDNATKRPGAMRLGSFQAIAHGADGVLFFQWRASRSGAEKFHSAMVPQAGTSSRTWREVTQLGTELKRLDAITGSRIDAEVAILLDWDSWWALELEGKLSSQVLLQPALRRVYASFFVHGVAVDFAHPARSLAGYRLVVAPHLYLVDEAIAANLREFVAVGGTLLLTYFSGIADANDRLWSGAAPQPFAELLGLEIEEYAPHADGRPRRVRTADGRTFEATIWSDIIGLRGAEALATFADDWYSGRPAATRHRFGEGTALYVGTTLDSDGLAWLLTEACAAAGVQFGRPSRGGVEVVRRSSGEDSWWFYLNYGMEAASIELDEPGVDALTGETRDGSITVPPTDVVIVRSSARGSVR